MKAKDNSRVVGIIQARMGSSRLPGKMMMKLGDRPLLEWVIRRTNQANKVSEWCVATSTASENDIIEKVCCDQRVDCYRGSEDDVLGRFLEAARSLKADAVVRVNADNPFVEPVYIDKVVEELIVSSKDYFSFAHRDGTPVMLSAISFFAEALRMECLKRAAESFGDRTLREHVTLGIYQSPSCYDVDFLTVPKCCDDRSLRFTVDTREDLELLREIVSAAEENIIYSSPREIVSLVQQNSTWLRKMNQLNREQKKSEG